MRLKLYLPNTGKARSAIKRLLSLLVPTIIILSFCQCAPRPTYPKDKIIESISKICKQEYNVDVNVKIVGHTVGVYIPLDNLFDSELHLAPQVADKVDDVVMSTSRVVLSSDTDLNFYRIVAADTKVIGAELVMVRYLPDIRKFYYMDVSRGEYLKRMLWDIKFSPQIVARKTIRELFEKMQTQNMDEIISAFFVKKPRVSLGAMDFFQSLKELNMKNNIEYRILALKSAVMANNYILVYCRTLEDYTPKNAFADYIFLYPRQFNNEYLAIVSVKGVNAVIEQIIPLYRKIGNNLIREFPAQFISLRNVDTWPDTDFVFRDMSLGEFLAEQIARRIKELLSTDYSVRLVQGNFDWNKKVLRFMISAKGKKDDIKLEGQGLEKIVDLIATVLYNYNFNDYSKVLIHNLTTGKETSYSKEELQKRKKETLGIKKFFIKKGKKQ